MAEATRMEFITEEVYRRLLNPDLFDEISRFVFIHGKFEEIPIINRYNDVVFLEKNFSPREISMCLFHLAQRLLLDIRAYFPSKEMADKFIHKVNENNFIVFSNTIVDDNYDCNFQVGISRKDSLDDIHQITWLLLDLAEELDGYYDGWECGIVE